MAIFLALQQPQQPLLTTRDVSCLLIVRKTSKFFDAASLPSVWIQLVDDFNRQQSLPYRLVAEANSVHVDPVRFRRVGSS